jgi:hypothetical protein
MRCPWRSLVVATLLGPAVAAAGESAGVPRSELEQLEAQLDQAVGKVSRPSAGIVLGRAEGSRGYHLPGFGAVFVLAPRALPRTGGVMVFTPGMPPGAVIHIEESVSSDDSRPPGAPPPPSKAGRKQMKIRSGGKAVPLDPEEAQRIAEVEAQVAAFQKEAEEARQAAEREFEQLAFEMQVMLAPPVPVAPDRPETPAQVVRAPSSPRPPSAPAPPPWHFWFDSRETSDPRAPEDVVADVRSAVMATLESHGAIITGLSPDEHVAVAVDFVAGGPFAQARPAKTLVVRARRKDLDEHARGRLSADDLRKRIEIVEY